MELSMWQTRNFLEMVNRVSASLPPMDRCEFQGVCTSLVSDDERIAELKDEVEELEQENRRLETKNEKLGEEVEELEQDNRRLETENEKLEEKVDALKCDIETQETKLLEKIVELEGKIKEFEGKKENG